MQPAVEWIVLKLTMRLAKLLTPKLDKLLADVQQTIYGFLKILNVGKIVHKFPMSISLSFQQQSHAHALTLLNGIKE